MVSLDRLLDKPFPVMNAFTCMRYQSNGCGLSRSMAPSTRIYSHLKKGAEKIFFQSLCQLCQLCPSTRVVRGSKRRDPGSQPRNQGSQAMGLGSAVLPFCGIKDQTLSRFLNQGSEIWVQKMGSAMKKPAYLVTALRLHISLFV